MAQNTMVIRRNAGQAVSGRWPGLSPLMAQAAQKVMSNKTPDPNKYFTRPHTFFHRVDYAAAGQTSLNLFNVNPAAFICNLPVQGTIQQETFFKLEYVRLVAQTGITAAATYTRAAGGAQATLTNTPFTNAEEIRTIMEGGALTLSVGDKRIVDNLYDLTQFPSGKGMAGAFAVENTNTTVVNTAAFVNNGAPASGNGFMFRPGFPLLPGKPIAGQLTWQAALAATTAFVIRVELCGLLVSPSNN